MSDSHTVAPAPQIDPGRYATAATVPEPDLQSFVNLGNFGSVEVPELGTKRASRCHALVACCRAADHSLIVSEIVKRRICAERTALWPVAWVLSSLHQHWLHHHWHWQEKNKRVHDQVLLLTHACKHRAVQFEFLVAK